ncbi:hypothetical protein CspHIS471_0105230 [Cutaneotrichosporon sp. HIS471]|nr:hypothetical protein CspHIS471_0105230 [Cutaneotrichosporon sp. HIS471]
MPSLEDDVPSCSLWPFGRRRQKLENSGWARLPETDEKSVLAPPSSLSAYSDTSRHPLPAYSDTPRPPPLPPRPNAYATLAPLRPVNTGRSHASSVSAGSVTASVRTVSTGEYMSLDADPFDDPESPARVEYLSTRLAWLQQHTHSHSIEPPVPIDQPLSLLDIQDPKARAPVRVAATLGDTKLASLGKEERRLARARAEADAWRHEANLVYHQLCAARILAVERMYERNAWRERCEAVEEERERERERERNERR